MQYRVLGRTGLEVSALGFGLMRFLTRSGRPTWGRGFDDETAMKLLKAAYRNGINYFDTAYNYMGGRSETFMGQFLKTVPRRKVIVATKLPVWLVKRPSDFRRLFNVQSKRLGTDHIDLYLLHALHETAYRRVAELGVFDFLDSLKQEGRIRFVGFSFHDKGTCFAPIVDAYGWDFCQIQYNIVDEHEQAGTAGLKYAARRGLGVVVMEPLRGGDLVNRLSPAVEGVWKAAKPAMSPAEWCLKWIWSHPEVSAVLSGMNTREQLDENMRIAGEAVPGVLTPAGMKVISRVQDAYKALHRVGCTTCGYCLPCPSGVIIPRNFVAYNESSMFPDSAIPMMEYNSWMKPETRASNCSGCGECEQKCPQHIPIRARLAEVHQRLGRK